MFPISMKIFVQLFSKTLLKKIKVKLAVDFDLNLPKFGKKRGAHEFLEAPFHNYYTPQITVSHQEQLKGRLHPLIIF